MTPLQQLVRGVGVVSVALGALAVVAPRRVASAGGVADPSPTGVTVLVRLAAARQVSLGLALLTRSPVPVARAAGLFLPLTALDAAAVLHASRSGLLAPRAARAALVVLATDIGVSLLARRDATR